MVTLTPIAQDNFERFLESEIAEYAQNKVKSGNLPTIPKQLPCTKKWATL